jgi:hypothetical protein
VKSLPLKSPLHVGQGHDDGVDATVVDVVTQLVD